MLFNNGYYAKYMTSNREKNSPFHIKGYKPKKHVNSGGSIIRNALKQLESIGLVSKTESNGRIITSKCSSLIDKASTEILNQLINTIPDLKRYVSDKNE